MTFRIHTGGMTETPVKLLDGQCFLRRATADDLDAILVLLSDDPISVARGDAGRPEDRSAYDRAFAAIDADPAQQLLVAVIDDDVVGTMQLTVIPGLARRGAARLQIEAVRVRSDTRNLGIGAAMMRWAIGRAPDLGVALVQLTSDAQRVDAHRFYERLGFSPSHVGFKLTLPVG